MTPMTTTSYPWRCTYLPTYLPTYLLTYLLTYLPTYLSMEAADAKREAIDKAPRTLSRLSASMLQLFLAAFVR